MLWNASEAAGTKLYDACQLADTGIVTCECGNAWEWASSPRLRCNIVFFSDGKSHPLTMDYNAIDSTLR